MRAIRQKRGPLIIPGFSDENCLQANLVLSNLGFGATWRQFSIEAGSFYDCVIPEDAEALWGPVPVPKLPPTEAENNCKAVTHRLAFCIWLLFEV